MSQFVEAADRGVIAALAFVLLAVGVSTAQAGPRTPPPRDAFDAPVVEIKTSIADIDGFAVTQRSPKTLLIRLDAAILFAKDSARIRPEARARLRELTRTLGGLGPGRITVTGYTDDLGSAQHGLELSHQRATAVAAQLGRELPPRRFRILARGRGEANPAVPNTSEMNRAKNRRVLIELRGSNDL